MSFTQPMQWSDHRVYPVTSIMSADGGSCLVPRRETEAETAGCSGSRGSGVRCFPSECVCVSACKPLPLPKFLPRYPHCIQLRPREHRGVSAAAPTDPSSSPCFPSFWPDRQAWTLSQQEQAVQDRTHPSPLCLSIPSSLCSHDAPRSVSQACLHRCVFTSCL